MTSGICIRYALYTIKHSLKNSHNSDPHKSAYLNTPGLSRP